MQGFLDVILVLLMLDAGEQETLQPRITQIYTDFCCDRGLLDQNSPECFVAPDTTGQLFILVFFF